MGETIEETVQADSGSDVADSGSDRVKPWTIKGIALEERNAAIAAADRADMTIGEWLSRAIRTQVQADREASRAPVPVNPQSSQADLDAIERMIAMARDLSSVTGEPPPKSVSRVAYSLIRGGLTAIRTSRTARTMQ